MKVTDNTKPRIYCGDGLVSPMLAEKLKDCGYNADCTMCYMIPEDDSYAELPVIYATDLNQHKIGNSSFAESNGVRHITAPTLSAANEFLRSLYGMFVSVEPYGCKDAIRYKYKIWSLDEGKFDAEPIREFGGFDNQYEVMNDGLLFILEKILRL